jgi:surface protein
MFDTPTTHSVWCLRCTRKRLLYFLLLICISVIIFISIVAGVCSSGNCGNNINNENSNATSLQFDNNGKLCSQWTISSSVPSPTVKCPSPTQQPPYTTTINSDAPIPSPTNEDITPYKAFTSTQELYDAVDEFLMTGISNPIYGPSIGLWNISLLTNLSNVFNAYDRNPRAMHFNENLSGWDTSRVTTMENLFLDARTFNGDVSTWQTSNVVNMHETFGRAISFNGDITNWDVSKVTTIARMCESILISNCTLLTSYTPSPFAMNL